MRAQYIYAEPMSKPVISLGTGASQVFALLELNKSHTSPYNTWTLEMSVEIQVILIHSHGWYYPQRSAKEIQSTEGFVFIMIIN